MVKLLIQIVLSKIRVLFSGRDPVYIKPFISKKMKCEIRDSGDHSYYLLFVNNSHTSYKFFSVYGTNLVP